MPFSRGRWRGERTRPEPTAASTWNQAPRGCARGRRARRAGRSRRGRSSRPCRRSRSRAGRRVSSSSASSDSAPVASVGTPITASVPSPSSAAERRMLSWLARRGHDPPVVGRQAVARARSRPPGRAPAAARAGSRPSRPSSSRPSRSAPSPCSRASQRDERVLDERRRRRGVEGVHRLVGHADRQLGRGGRRSAARDAGARPSAGRRAGSRRRASARGPRAPARAAHPAQGTDRSSAPLPRALRARSRRAGRALPAPAPAPPR